MIELGVHQLCCGVFLILANVLITFLLQLAVSRKLLLVTLRGGVQLIALGCVLEWIFEQSSPWTVVIAGLLMVAIASRTAVVSCNHRFPKIYLHCFCSIGLSALVTVSIALFVILKADPWCRANIAIPITGMIIGNSLTAIVLALGRFLEDLQRDRTLIETQLALGATRWEAMRQTARAAIGRGLVPITNLMTVVGVVSLPGTMTGLLVSGANVAAAVQFQFLILILIMTCAVLATITTVMFAAWRLSNSSHQIFFDHVCSHRKQEASC